MDFPANEYDGYRAALVVDPADQDLVDFVWVGNDMNGNLVSAENILGEPPDWRLVLLGESGRGTRLCTNCSTTPSSLERVPPGE